MRLLNVNSFRLHIYHPPSIPRYAVASHRWSKGGEAPFRDFEAGVSNSKDPRYDKVRGFCHFMRNNIPDIEWLWIDTICVDETSSSEVSEMVNSMFKWYQSAVICLAYLMDVSRVTTTADMLSEFKESEWFKRGWTLQELLAPRLVVFLSQGWRVIGHKGDAEAHVGVLRTGLEIPLVHIIASITKIPEEVLLCYEKSSAYTLKEKELWRGDRRTTRPEDLAYCMLGIFDVHIPLIYGEGFDEAMGRIYDAVESKQARLERYGGRVQVPELEDCHQFAVTQRMFEESKTDASLTRAPPSDISWEPLIDDIQTRRERNINWSSTRFQEEENNPSLSYRIIGIPQQNNNKYTYYIDGNGLSRHLVKRHCHAIKEPSTEVFCKRRDGRDEYLVHGALLDEHELKELKHQSREYKLGRRLDDCLYPGK